LEVAARVIEIVSGTSFDTFLERRIFKPLGMGSTYFWVPERDKLRLATLYAPRGDALVASDVGPTSRLLTPPAVPRASGGLVSTARDYDRFLAMIAGDGALEGTRVLPAEAVRLGTSNLLPPGADMSGFAAGALSGGYGAGASVSVVGPRLGNYGWGGVSGTTAFVNRRLQTRLSTFTNIGLSGFGREVTAAVEGPI
jgi:CubicO group peptidase (beta-lactamase class C family)